MTNAGFTFRRGLNLIEDDRLGVELAVRISDHLENVDGATQVVLIYICIQFYQARALRALGLLLVDGTPTVGGGKTF